MRIDSTLSRILRRTRVIDSELESAVARVSNELWSSISTDSVRVADFHRGRLHVVVDTHARLAEAKGILAELFRSRVNEILLELLLADTSATVVNAFSRNSENARDALYVSRVDFHVEGTYE